MKILERSIGIPHSQLKQLGSIKHGYKQANNTIQDSAVLTSSRAKDIYKTSTYQTQIQQYEQADQLLNDLLENIQYLQDQPSVLYQNIKETIENLDKKYPQFAARLNQIPLDVSQLAAEINAVKQEISQAIQEERRAVSYYLIAEQNKDSVSRILVNDQMISRVKQEIKTQPIDIHSHFKKSVKRLLSDIQ